MKICFYGTIFLLSRCGSYKGKFLMENISSKGYEKIAVWLRKSLQNQGFMVLDTIEHKKIADENDISIRPQKNYNFYRAQSCIHSNILQSKHEHGNAF